MYKFFFTGQLVGTTALEHTDPPMGVVFGRINLNCEKGAESIFLEELGAISEDGLLCIRVSILVVVNEFDTPAPHDGCQVVFEPDPLESEVELVATPYPAYGELLPKHTEKYFGPNT